MLFKLATHLSTCLDFRLIPTFWSYSGVANYATFPPSLSMNNLVTLFVINLVNAVRFVLPVGGTTCPQRIAKSSQIRRQSKHTFKRKRCMCEHWRTCVFALASDVIKSAATCGPVCYVYSIPRVRYTTWALKCIIWLKKWQILNRTEKQYIYYLR